MAQITMVQVLLIDRFSARNLEKRQLARETLLYGGYYWLRQQLLGVSMARSGQFNVSKQRIKMSRLLCLLKVVVLVWIASAPGLASAAGGYILDAEGTVTITPDKKIAPRLVVKHDSVGSGAVIRTGDNSRAVLKFEDGQVVSMQANSTFQVREYRYEPQRIEQSSVVFSMFKGGMRFITGQIGLHNKQAFRLATPHATIGIRGTEFMVVVTNNATYSQVLSGSIFMTNAAGMAELLEGETGLTPSATAPTTTIPATSVPADTFGQIASITVPAAVAGPVPPPEKSDRKLAVLIPPPASVAAAPVSAGGAAAGGAAVSSAAAAGGAATGISATTIWIGVGVAGIVAAAAGGSSSTTQH